MRGLILILILVLIFGILSSNLKREGKKSPATTPPEISKPMATTTPTKTGPVIKKELEAMTDENLDYTITFKEYIEIIPRLKELGVKTIYLTPIWEHVPIPKTRYAIKDYNKIDPARGTREELKQMIGEAHKNDMRVIFDLVTVFSFYNPCRKIPVLPKQQGWITVNRPEWLLKDLNGKITCCYRHENWGAAVDRSNPEVIDFFANLTVSYIEEFDVDGFRIDAPTDNYCNLGMPECDHPVVGEHHITGLIKEVRKRTKEVKPDSILFAEEPFIDPFWKEKYLEALNQNPFVEPDVPPLLDEFTEASTGYTFWGFFLAKVKTNEVSSNDLVNYLKNEKIWYKTSRARLVETHDTKGKYLLNSSAYKPSVVMMNTIPGMPWIWVEEVLTRKHDILGRSLGPIEFKSDNFELYKKLSKIRDENPALKSGSIENVWKAGDRTYAYLRSYDKNKVVVIINLQDRVVSSVLDLPFDSGATLYDIFNNEKLVVDDPHNFRVSLPAYGARILVLGI